jgi:hypothetical protein
MQQCCEPPLHAESVACLPRASIEHAADRSHCGNDSAVLCCADRRVVELRAEVAELRRTAEDEHTLGLRALKAGGNVACTSDLLARQLSCSPHWHWDSDPGASAHMRARTPPLQV